MRNRRLLFIGILMAIVTGVLPGQVLHESIAFYREGNNGGPYSHPDMIEKDSQGNVYFILEDRHCDETFLGDVEVPCLYYEQDFNEGYQSYLVKVSPDLAIDTFLVIKSRTSILKNLELSENRLFLGYFNSGHVIDTIKIGEETVSLNQGGVFVFDHDLEYQGELFPMDKAVDNMASNDDYLYIQAFMTDGVSSNNHYTVIGSDTLWNFGVFEGGGLSNITPFVISYDLQADSIVAFWKFGSDGEGYVNDMLVDHNGDLVLLYRSGWALWLDFNGPELITEGNADHILKYNPDGTLAFAQGTPFDYSTIRLGETGYYMSGSFNGPQFVFAGDTIFNDCYDGFGPYKSLLYKYDFSGELDWYFYADEMGCSERSTVYIFNENNDVLSCAYRFNHPSFSIQGSSYDIEGGAIGIINLDTQTGNPVNHKVYAAEEWFSLAYLEGVSENRFKLLFVNYEGADFIGLPLGIQGKDVTYFAEFTLDMVTSTNIAPIEPTSNFQLSPNPLHPGTALSLSDVPAGTYTIAVHSITGALLHEEQVYLHKGTNHLGWQPQAAGLYAVSLTSRSQRYTGLVVVQE